MIDLLVIEPSISVRKTLERLLESSGYTMRGVSRGADALGQVSRQRPDLILSEVNLPDGGGLELCQQFRLVGLPVVLMSAAPSEQLRRESLGAGALELLSKPLSEQRLLNRLAYHLKLPAPALQTPQAAPTLLSSLMTRPGMLGVVLLNGRNELLEQLGREIPAALYRPFLIGAGSLEDGRAIGQAAPPDSEGRSAPRALYGSGQTALEQALAGTTQGDSLQCAQLEYPGHCLLLFRLPSLPGTLVCLIQNNSYATLIKYYLRSSPYVRL